VFSFWIRSNLITRGTWYSYSGISLLIRFLLHFFSFNLYIDSVRGRSIVLQPSAHQVRQSSLWERRWLKFLLIEPRESRNLRGGCCRISLDTVHAHASGLWIRPVLLAVRIVYTAQSIRLCRLKGRRLERTVSTFSIVICFVSLSVPCLRETRFIATKSPCRGFCRCALNVIAFYTHYTPQAKDSLYSGSVYCTHHQKMRGRQFFWYKGNWQKVNERTKVSK
jgi:hypothetical protein